MKLNVFFVAVASLALFACDKFKTIDIDTTLSANMIANVEKPDTQQNLKSASVSETGYPFAESDTIDLADNKDVKKYLEDIEELEVYKASCKLNGIPDGEVISTLTVKADKIGLSVTLNDLSENNSEISLEIGGKHLKALGDELLKYKKIILSIEGISSYAPLMLSVTLDFETTVTAKILD